MGYVKRTFFDHNLHEGTARIAEDFELEYIKMPQGNLSAKVQVLCVTNSSEYTSRVCSHFYIILYGKRAERFVASMKKGYGFWYSGELVDIVEKTEEPNLKKKITTRYNAYKVKQFHIVSVPNQEAQSELFTDLFVDLPDGEHEDKPL